MKFYVDFEATQPEQEIISIGVVAENGEEFYSLIKPKYSKVSDFITKLTGIRQEDVELAPEVERVFERLYAWLWTQEYDMTKWQFYSYGNADIAYVMNSLSNTTSETHLTAASIMITRMKDYSEDVCKYFCCQRTSLLNAYKYLYAPEAIQKHNALEDAQMLAEVAKKIEGANPMAHCPFNQTKKQYALDAQFEWPVGKVVMKTLGKKPKIRTYDSLREALEWIIETTVNKHARPNVSRKKMAKKVLVAIKNNEPYRNYKWTIIKEEQE